jgi:outer membrane murein-binding lipoprotein Lpp
VLWVAVFAAIALAGLVLAGCYAVWLAHKAADLWSEVRVLSERVAQLGELVSRVGEAPDPRAQGSREWPPQG